MQRFKNSVDPVLRMSVPCRGRLSPETFWTTAPQPPRGQKAARKYLALCSAPLQGCCAKGGFCSHDFMKVLHFQTCLPLKRAFTPGTKLVF